MNWYFKCWKNYGTFSGRARRKEFWLFTLFDFLAIVIFTVLDISLKCGYLTPIYMAAGLIPRLAVDVRRLHDTDHGGGWYFIQFVPLVGPIIFLIYLLQEGTKGPNRFGDDPKEFAD